MSQGQEDHGARSDREAVVRALLELDDPPAIGDGAQLEDEELCEVLFDRFDDFVPRRFFHLAMRFRHAEMTRKADRVLARLYLFLDPGRVARHGVVKLVTDLMAERRIRPFGAWEERALEEVAEMLRTDPGDAIAAAPGEDGLEKPILQDVARFFNSMDLPYRRLVWLTCVQQKSLPQVVKETELPYERVEWLLAEIEKDVEEIVDGHFRRLQRYRSAAGEGGGGRDHADAGPQEGERGDGDGDSGEEEMEHGS